MTTRVVKVITYIRQISNGVNGNKFPKENCLFVPAKKTLFSLSDLGLRVYTAHSNHGGYQYPDALKAEETAGDHQKDLKEKGLHLYDIRESEHSALDIRNLINDYNTYIDLERKVRRGIEELLEIKPRTANLLNASSHPGKK